MAVGGRKREVQVASGRIELVREDGHWLLMQGGVALDVTEVIGHVNNPLGTVSLRVRETTAPRRLALREAPAVEPSAELVDA
ncbi:MAG TPA: hypothetical protein VFU74_21955 [Actinocrinis sp.]|nr:hypothetical protein [Actinocrinis sp.]